MDMPPWVTAMLSTELNDGHFCDHRIGHDGVVHISLIEGRNGEVFLKGNRHTRASYITDRVHVNKGEIESMAELAEKLRRFNGTNDVQLRVSLKAGAEAGTTDYVLTAREPQNSMVTIYTDNAGSETVKRWSLL